MESEELYRRYTTLSKLVQVSLLFGLGGISAILALETLGNLWIAGTFFGGGLILMVLYSPFFQLEETIKLETEKSPQEIKKDFSGKDNLFFEFYKSKLQEVHEESQKAIANFDGDKKISLKWEDTDDGLKVTSEEDGSSYSNYEIEIKEKENLYEVEYVGNMSEKLSLLQVLITGFLRGHYFKKFLESNGYTLIDANTEFLT